MQQSSSPNSSDGPLSGLRILDFTSVVVGPVATRMLADYGADVIKIEAPHGDPLRQLGGASKTGELSPKFMQMNGDKRSLVIDLKSDEGQKIIRNLLREADVVAINMRSKALAKLGLTFKDCRAINPKIVYCSIAGFGSTGRYFDKPAYDTIIQGVAGVAACNERTTGMPRYVPMVLADHLVALIATQMILLGLRSRDLTGEPQSLEIPMFENVASFVLREHFGQRAFVPKRGQTGDVRILDPNGHPAETKDGFICVSANTDKQVFAFFDAIGRPELKTDPRFDTVAARLENVSEYFMIRNQAFLEKTTSEWVEILENADVPVIAYNDLDALVEDPHLNDVGLFHKLDYAEEGKVLHMRPANAFSGGSRRNPQPAPMLGEHSEEILLEFGFDKDDIKRWIANGVVRTRAHARR